MNICYMFIFTMLFRMEEENNEALDESILVWIEENKENLQPMYEAYLEQNGQDICTFEEFATFYFYEAGH